MAPAGPVADAHAYPDQTLGRAGPHLAPLLFIPRPGGAAQSRQLPIIHPGNRVHADSKRRILGKEGLAC